MERDEVSKCLVVIRLHDHLSGVSLQSPLHLVFVIFFTSLLGSREPSSSQ